MSRLVRAESGAVVRSARDIGLPLRILKQGLPCKRGEVDRRRLLRWSLLLSSHHFLPRREFVNPGVAFARRRPPVM